MMKKEKMCLLGLLPALTVPMTLPCLAGNNAELPPNIIVVLTDDMGYGDIGIYGGKFIPTPNIDRMAEEGSRFNQYYSASPISSPSRCGLLTGMYPGKWHITTYLQGKAGNKAAEMADYLDPPAPQMILIIRCLYCLHPKMHPEIKNDSLIIILYIKSYLPFLNKLTIVMICDILF